jgi:hypothetical protein
LKYLNKFGTYDYDNKRTQQYLKEFKAFSSEIISSRESTQKFLIRSGINDKKGKLSKAYSLTTKQVTKK